MTDIYEPIAASLKDVDPADKEWVKHRAHIMIIRMVQRLEEQKEELTKKLNENHTLTVKTNSMLEKAKAFQDWYYKMFNLDRYFDFDGYLGARRKYFSPDEEEMDRKKVFEVWHRILNSCLPKYLGVQIKSIKLSRPLVELPGMNFDISLETLLAKTSASMTTGMNQPAHLEVPLQGDGRLRFEISGAHNEGRSCDFVNLVAANGLVTWIGQVGLEMEVRLWAEEGLEKQYQEAIG